MAKRKKVKFKSKPGKSKILGFLLIFLLLLAAGGIVALYAGYLFYTKDLPNFKAITGYKPKLITEVYSSDGTLIAEFAAERRKLIAYDDIPPQVKNAFIAIEDRRFFEHEGVDIKSIIGAMFENIQEGDWVRGASTITQQVIKNILLTPERTMTRKIKEAILAHRIENNLTKEEILYLYLNHIYLADGTYGVEAASRDYFGKSAKDLNLAEAAILAGLPKKPEYFSPRKHLDRALERQKLVLSKMEEAGFITEDERIDAQNYRVEIVPKKRINDDLAPHFVEHVRRYLQEKVGVRDFVNGGYTVFTTLDLDLNLEAQWALRRGILNLEARHGRKMLSEHLSGPKEIKKFRDKQDIDDVEIGSVYEAVVVEVPEPNGTVYKAKIGIGNVDGELEFAVSKPLGTAVEGLQSSYPGKLAAADGYEDISLADTELKPGDVVQVKVNKSEDEGYNFSLDFTPLTQAALISMETNGMIRAMVGGYDFEKSQFNRTVQALRQPGSSFKPILYSAALAKGYTETSVLYDMPVVVKDWAPQNYDGSYQGAMILRRALAKSRNLASVRLIMDINPKYVVKYAKNFGFSSTLQPYPSLALGGSDVRVIEMAQAYNVFASGGKLVEPQFILRIYDRDGKIVEDNTGGKFMTRDESLKVERQEARMEVLKQLAQKNGRQEVLESEYIKEEVLTDKSDINSNAEALSFLTPAEFLALLRSGGVDFSSLEKSKQTVTPDTAYIMSDLLQAVVKEGTGRRALKLTSKAPIAGKTGTTNEYTDAWFVGFSPKITTAVWVGRDNHRSLGKREAGSTAALPIWIDYMEDALAKYPGGVFKQPSSIKMVSTPYGYIPYSLDSLRDNVIDTIRNRVMIDGREVDIENSNMYYPEGYNTDGRKQDTETEIDFLLRR